MKTLCPTSKARFHINAAALYLHLTWKLKAVEVRTDNGNLLLWRRN
jgi:hypothetical protein